MTSGFGAHGLYLTGVVFGICAVEKKWLRHIIYHSCYHLLANYRSNQSIQANQQLVVSIQLNGSSPLCLVLTDKITLINPRLPQPDIKAALPTRADLRKHVNLAHVILSITALCG